MGLPYDNDDPWKGVYASVATFIISPKPGDLLVNKTDCLFVLGIYFCQTPTSGWYQVKFLDLDSMVYDGYSGLSATFDGELTWGKASSEKFLNKWTVVSPVDNK